MTKEYTIGMNMRGERGFIALMAVIVVGIVLLGLSAQEGLAGWNARFNVLTAENKEQATALAEGCADQALALLVADPNYIPLGECSFSPPQTITEQGVCSITIDTCIAGLAQLESQGEVQGAFANLSMTVNLNDVHIGDVSIIPTTGTLVVQMVMKNDNDGTSEIDDFTVSVPGGSPSSYTGVDSRAISLVGAYAISINGPVGYTTSFSGDCDASGAGSLDAGDSNTCLVTLDDVPTTITLVANVINNNGGTKSASDFQLTLDGNPVAQNTPITVSPGTHTADGPNSNSEYAASDWGYQCDDDGDVTVSAGDAKTCVINFDDLTPPAPQCADTLLMLDRTGSMNSTDLANERTAAKALLDLYEALNPAPQVAIGRFGISSSNSNAEVQARGQLTNDYGDDDSGSDTDNDLYHAIEVATLSGSNVYTNLASAITVGDTELNSSRHDSGKEKVLILISDGEPNRPCSDGSESCGSSVTTYAKNEAEDAADLAKQGTGSSYKHADGIPTEIFTIHFGSAGSGSTNMTYLASLATNSSYNQSTTDTGNQLPSSNNSPNSWSNSSFAWQNDASYATSGSAGSQQGFTSFGLQSSIPSGSSIQGIEISVGGKTGNIGTGLFSSLDSSFGTGSSAADISGWDEEGTDSNTTTLAQASGAGNDSASPDGSRFAKIGYDGAVGEWICHSVSGSAYSSLLLSYYWRGDSDSEAGEKGIVEYRSGGSCTNTTGWTTLASLELRDGQSWSSLQSAALPANLNGFIRFRNTSNETNEFFRVDGVQITGGNGGASGSCTLGVALSWDNGNNGSWTSVKNITLNPSEPGYPGTVIGGATDLWGRSSWTTGELDSDFAVRLTNNNCTGASSAQVNYVTAKVYYTGFDPDEENTDGDHFFVAPTSADMEDVFTTIGALVCPAADPDATAPPTMGTLIVVTHVINDDTGSKDASEFEMTVAGDTFPGEESPGVTKSISPGNYNVGSTDDDDYDKTVGVNCSSSILGPISAGETRTCTITYNDNTPPPPPPNLDINIGSWKEKPKAP